LESRHQEACDQEATLTREPADGETSDGGRHFQLADHVRIGGRWYDAGRAV
jgi:hypothetical protein